MAMNSKQKKSKKQQVDERDGSCCCWCRKPFLPDDLTIEHMNPKSMGGKNDLENLRLSCRPCNLSRGNKPFPPGYSASWDDVFQLVLLNISQDLGTP